MAQTQVIMTRMPYRCAVGVLAEPVCSEQGWTQPVIRREVRPMPGTLCRFLAEDDARLEGLFHGSMTEANTVIVPPVPSSAWACSAHQSGGKDFVPAVQRV